MQILRKSSLYTHFMGTLDANHYFSAKTRKFLLYTQFMEKSDKLVTLIVTNFVAKLDKNHYIKCKKYKGNYHITHTLWQNQRKIITLNTNI